MNFKIGDKVQIKWNTRAKVYIRDIERTESGHYIITCQTIGDKGPTYIVKGLNKLIKVKEPKEEKSWVGEQTTPLDDFETAAALIFKHKNSLRTEICPVINGKFIPQNAWQSTHKKSIEAIICSPDMMPEEKKEEKCCLLCKWIESLSKEGKTRKMVKDK